MQVAQLGQGEAFLEQGIGVEQELVPRPDVLSGFPHDDVVVEEQSCTGLRHPPGVHMNKPAGGPSTCSNGTLTA